MWVGLKTKIFLIIFSASRKYLWDGTLFSGLDGLGVSGRAKKKCVENRFMIIKAQLDQVLAGESYRREKL